MMPSLVALSLALAPAPRPQIYMQALIVTVDAEFASKMKWIEDGAPATHEVAWGPAVVALFHRAGTEKTVIHSRPSLMLEDDQTGYFNVAPKQTEAVKALPEDLAGRCGYSVRVRPTASGDGVVRMRIEATTADVEPTTIAGVAGLNTETTRVDVLVRNGRASCVCIGSPSKDRSTVNLAFLTPHTISAAAPRPNPFIHPKPVPEMETLAGLKDMYRAALHPDAETVAGLVAAYRAACDRQDAAAATRLAVKALALDPTCFK